jgi:hypothetical protein
MDLFLSSQSVGMVALLAAGCMVAAGLASSSRARRRALERQAKWRDNATLQTFAPGRHVIVTGVLRVEGSCCPRLEDAAPVAATTFQHKKSRRGPTVSWCQRAVSLRLVLGEASLAIDGPVRVEVGSEEHYPGCALEKLRGRVTERIFASDMVPARERGDVPQHGVFRSLRHGDEVVVAGMAERAPHGDGPTTYRAAGGGWRIVPDQSGAVTVCCRRRPVIRGALGVVRVYAAALAAVLTAVVAASFASAQQPGCESDGQLCKLYGWCGARLEIESSGVAVSCAPTSESDCRRSAACELRGACSPEGNDCVVTSANDCRRSVQCEAYGLCRLGDGECVRATEPAPVALR